VFWAAKHRMFAPEMDESRGEIHQGERLVVAFPGEPADFVVLAVAVVVSVLGASVFVAAAKHGNALGKEKGGEEIAALAAAEFVDFGIVGRTFRAAVPREVVIVAVVVVFAVGLVVLLVVADEV